MKKSLLNEAQELLWKLYTKTEMAEKELGQLLGISQGTINQIMQGQELHPTKKLSDTFLSDLTQKLKEKLNG